MKSILDVNTPMTIDSKQNLLSSAQVRLDFLSALSDVDALALTLYGEDRGNPNDGDIMLIAFVILNRLASATADAKVSDIVGAPFQFSPWNEGSSSLEQLMELDRDHDPVFKRMVAITRDAVALYKRGENPLPSVKHFVATANLELGAQGSVTAFLDFADDGVTVIKRDINHWVTRMRVVAQSTTHTFLI